MQQLQSIYLLFYIVLCLILFVIQISIQTGIGMFDYRLCVQLILVALSLQLLTSHHELCCSYAILGCFRGAIHRRFLSLPYV